MKNKELTPSQQVAHEKLDFFFKLGLSGIDTVEGISPRPIPLIVGPSGCGKTFLIGNLATKYELPLFCINIPNWIVRGTRNEAQGTLEQLREFIASNERGVIFLDEVNKLFGSHVSQSAWMADVFTEFIALTDKDGRLENMGLSGLVETLQRNFIIVGAAAFQDEWNASKKTSGSIGFTGADQILEGQESSFEHAINTQSTIPEELLFRFNDRLIVILPPTRAEFAKRIASIRGRLSLPPLEEAEIALEADSAVKSGKAMRWLEGYLTECLRQVSQEVLNSLSTNPYEISESTDTTPSSENALSKMDPKKITALRDACYERFENCLRELSSSSRQLHLLIEGAMIGYRIGVNDSGRARLSEAILIMGQDIAPDQSSESQLLIFGRGLNFLAEKGLGLTSALGSSAERGRLAADVNRIAGKITEVMPYLLARCGESSEEKSIREHALHFCVHAEGVSHHLADLKKMDAQKGVR